MQRSHTTARNTNRCATTHKQLECLPVDRLLVGCHPRNLLRLEGPIGDPRETTGRIIVCSKSVAPCPAPCAAPIGNAMAQPPEKHKKRAERLARQTTCSCLRVPSPESAAGQAPALQAACCKNRHTGYVSPM